jgi:hypothetical protein
VDDLYLPAWLYVPTLRFVAVALPTPECIPLEEYLRLLFGLLQHAPRFDQHSGQSRLRLASVEPGHALTLIVSIAEYTPEEQTGADRVLRAATQSLVAFHVQKADPTATAAVDKISSNVSEHSAAAMLLVLREPLTHGNIEDSDEAHAIRRRAVQLLAKLTKNACEPILHMLKQQLGSNALTPQEEVHFKNLTQLANAIASGIFFASGAHQESHTKPPVITSPEQSRFYWEVDGVFDQLAAIGLPGLAQHLVETLEMYIPIDPAGVFLRVAAVVHVGRTWDPRFDTSDCREISCGIQIGLAARSSVPNCVTRDARNVHRRWVFSRSSTGIPHR